MTDPTPQTPLESHLPESDNIDPNEALASTPSEQSTGNTPLRPSPEFTHSKDDNGDVVSYDPRLNSDGLFFSIEYGLLIKVTFNSTGEALHHFLLSQARSSPAIRISCGTKSDPSEVTVFDFCIDIVPEASVVPWSVADDKPAYRGRMEREFEGSAGTKPDPKVEEIKLHKEWAEHRKVLGLAPWVSRVDNTNFDGSGSGALDGLRSSKTLRQWADEYCASPKKMKDFVYKKVLLPYLLFQYFVSKLVDITGPLRLELTKNSRCHPIYDRLLRLPTCRFSLH